MDTLNRNKAVGYSVPPVFDSRRKSVVLVGTLAMIREDSALLLYLSRQPGPFHGPGFHRRKPGAPPRPAPGRYRALNKCPLVRLLAYVRPHRLSEKTLAILHFPKVPAALLTWIPGLFMTWVTIIVVFTSLCPNNPNRRPW